jgi:predicted O-methyltransferase YrrM
MYNIIKDFKIMNTIEEDIILVDSMPKKTQKTEIVTPENNYIFTVDWFSYNIQIWTHYLNSFKDRPNLRFLEIGSFQGRSTVWLLENILTNDSSIITCIDTFEGSIEHTLHFQNDIKNLFDIFSHNISKFKNKVNIIKNKSQDALKKINEQYDFIYVDGDHKASSVIEDAILSFPLLKKGGIMIFDDYLWFQMKKFIDNPKVAIDAFLEIYADKIIILYKNHQVIIEKL